MKQYGVFKILNYSIFGGTWRHTKFTLNFFEIFRSQTLNFIAFGPRVISANQIHRDSFNLLQLDNVPIKPQENIFRNNLSCL